MLNIATLSRIHRGLVTVVIVALLTPACNRREGTVVMYASDVPPECTIAARDSGSDIVVKVTIANHSQSPYRLLEWNLPSNGEMTAALFQVSRDGFSVEYRGRMVKRTVTADSYLTIAPGKSRSAEIPLLQGYDVRSAGHYTITYRAFNQRNDSSGIDTLVSNIVNVQKQ